MTKTTQAFALTDDRTRACQVFLLLGLLASWIVAIGSNVADAAILSGGEPDATYNSGAMKLWLRADQGVTTGGTFTWADQSTHGNDASQGTAGLQPTHITVGAGTINGNPVVDFDGSDSLLGSLNSPNLDSDSFTAFIVLDTPTAAATSFHPFDGNTSTNRFGFASYISGTNDYFLRFASNITSGVSQILDPILISTSGDPVSTNTIAQAIDGTNIQTAVFGTIQSISGYRIGSRFDGTAAFLDGSIAELIIYDEVLSSDDYNQVGYYLQNKYGITGSFTAPPAVPEPSTISLLGLGILGLVRHTRRHRRRIC